MRIALDYDETFTEDPLLWQSFIRLAKASGHEVKFVTYRPERYDDYNADILQDAKWVGIDIIFTAGKQKSSKYKADIWIDDSPETIPLARELESMYNGCKKNGEV